MTTTLGTDDSSTRWTVEERAWQQERPDLPDEIVALLAPPVVVSASTWTAPAAAVRAPQLLAPATPARKARRRSSGRAVPRAAARIG